MRLIDADDLKAKIMMEAPDFMDGGSSITKAFIMAMLSSRAATPTIDAVLVVRCRDCKYAHLTYDGECKYCDMEADDEGNIPERYRPWDWYCADGERKEE